MKYLLKIN